MIIVRLMGGMGNQMFQYALGRRLAYDNNTELKLDLGFFERQPINNANHVRRNFDLDVFKLAAKLASPSEVYDLTRRLPFSFGDKVLNRLIGLKPTYVREPHFHFAPEILSVGDGVFLEGYWQTEKYFASIDEILREDFEFREEISENAGKILERIRSSQSVCVNVRRGDFVTNSFHGTQDIDYYRQGEEIVRSRTDDATFFVFSDDIEWCEANLKFNGPATFVSHIYAGRKFQDYLRLMSACKHFIIPNSSFAWWAVWFNRDINKTVVAPKRWFSDPSWNTKDLASDNWIRI